jgi:hypothetical protein
MKAASGKPPARDAAQSEPPRAGMGTPPPPWQAWAWYVAAALAVLACGYVVVFNGDIWFHLAAGRWIAEHEAVPSVDAWSYTAAGRPWHDHEWLAQLIFHLWAQLFGLASLMIWKWLLLGATFLLLLRLLERLGAPLPLAFLILAFNLRLAMIFFEIRPHLYSQLFTVLVLRATLLDRGPRWLLPLVFLLWANLHAGVVFGLALLALLLAVEACCRRRDLGRLALNGLACLGATLLNPYGVGVLTYPLALLPATSASRELLVEWLSPFSPRGLNAPLFPWAIGALAVAVALLVAGGSLRRRPREAWGALLAALLTLAMAVSSRRFIPLFAIAASPLLALALAPAARRLAALAGVQRAPAWLREAAPPLAAVAIGLFLVLPRPLPAVAFRATTLSYELPTDTLDFAVANRLSGRLFAFYTWGGYVDWRTEGRLAVYIDPRAETLFAAATERTYGWIQNRGPHWQEMLEGSGAQWVLWPLAPAGGGDLPNRLVDSGRWVPIHRDAVSILLARRDAPLPDRVVPSAASPERDWAAAHDALDAQDPAAAERLLVSALDAMPDLAPACGDLAATESRLGPAAHAQQTLEACRAILRRLAAP